MENKEKKPEVPEFKPEYVRAFLIKLLQKVGGSETISLERLEQFPLDSAPDLVYDDDNKTWAMRSTVPAPVIVTVPKKILRKTPKILLS